MDSMHHNIATIAFSVSVSVSLLVSVLISVSVSYVSTDFGTTHCCSPSHHFFLLVFLELLYIYCVRVSLLLANKNFSSNHDHAELSANDCKISGGLLRFKR